MVHVEAKDTPERRAFYERISKQNLTPLWTVMSGLRRNPSPSAAPSAGNSLKSAMR
jgi:gentisate 1,2-dioxygenase